MAQDIVGSKMPADNSFGQNGFAGSSSDVPGQRTRSPLTVNADNSDSVLARIKREGVKRVDDIPARPIKPAMGMKAPGPNPAIPGDIKH